ncbi:outer membrane protein, partial [Acidocella sp.]|uniref:outer membrane protein n=1 Tax=Acidocella sp. TaxID=50710 RepID=UPI002615C825
MQFRAAFLAASALAAPFALATHAFAQPVGGVYVSLGAGLSLESTPKAKNLVLDGQNLPGWVRPVFKNGYDVQGSVGYGFDNGWRVELEGDYIRNGASKGKINGVYYPAASGVEGRYGGFVNGIFDFDVGLPWLYPYMGAGIGWQQVRFNGISGYGFNVDQSRGSLAYQGIVGLSFPIAPVMGLSATVEYRFIGLATARRYNGNWNGVPASFKQQGEYNNEFNVGLRYEFAPPAPPPPAPAAAP